MNILLAYLCIGFVWAIVTVVIQFRSGLTLGVDRDLVRTTIWNFLLWPVGIIACLATWNTSDWD